MLVAAGTAGAATILQATGLSPTGLGLRSGRARRALAWAGLQSPDVIAGLCELVEAARDVEARNCGHI